MIVPDFIQIPRPVLIHRDLQPSDKFLFGYIYWFTKLKLEKCTASNETLGQLAGITAKSVSNSLQRLESAGLIKREQTGSGPTTKRVVHCLVEYRPSNDGGLSIKSSTKEEYINNNKNKQKDLEASNIDFGGEAPPNSATPPSKNLEIRAMLQEIIDIINPKEKVTDSRIRELNGRLADGYTREEVIAAARVFSKSDWHKENNQMTVDNLIRPSKFGRWYSQISQDSPPTPEEVSANFKAESARLDKRNKEFLEGLNGVN